MSHITISKFAIKRLGLILTICFLAGGIFNNTAFALNDNAGNASNVIKSIPDFQREGSRNFLDQADQYYDFIGTLDYIQKDRLVVDDSDMKIAPDADISGARPGGRVGIRVNDAGEVVLCEPLKKSSGRNR